ncbi:MAG: RNA 2',3'-cyclic phosphodiesterase [Acidobacteriota bacterium]
MIRAFLAVELADLLRDGLASLQIALKQRLHRAVSRDVRISWVSPASSHLTIKFLGDIDESIVAPLCAAVTQAMQAHSPLEIPLERLGVFPRVQQPRVLWVGPTDAWQQGEDAKRLAALHAEVETCCRSFDLALESRGLSPHLTLARIKEGQRDVGQALTSSGALQAAVSLGTLAVASIALMRSELKPSGSVYTRLWKARLGA